MTRRDRLKAAIEAWHTENCHDHYCCCMPYVENAESLLDVIEGVLKEEESRPLSLADLNAYNARLLEGR